jgi:hypothetical protein
LYTCVNDYIDPKLRDIEKDLGRFRGGVSLDRKTQKQIDDLTEVERDLRAMRARLLDIAALSYKPDQNDGVLITAAPLWKCFRNRPWQGTLKKCWAGLNEGKYDWAHLAYAIWPDRVREACKKDKSIAIAHGLETLYEC